MAPNAPITAPSRPVSTLGGTPAKSGYGGWTRSGGLGIMVGVENTGVHRELTNLVEEQRCRAELLAAQANLTVPRASLLPCFVPPPSYLLSLPPFPHDCRWGLRDIRSVICPVANCHPARHLLCHLSCRRLPLGATSALSLGFVVDCATMGPASAPGAARSSFRSARRCTAAWGQFPLRH